MARKPKEKKPKGWNEVTNTLVDILEMFRIYKTTNKEYVKLEYFGTLQHLKKTCLKLVNIIDKIEEEQRPKEKENGPNSKDRRQEVSSSFDQPGHWTRARVVED